MNEEKNSDEIDDSYVSYLQEEYDTLLNDYSKLYIEFKKLSSELEDIRKRHEYLEEFLNSLERENVNLPSKLGVLLLMLTGLFLGILLCSFLFRTYGVILI